MPVNQHPIAAFLREAVKFSPNLKFFTKCCLIQSWLAAIFKQRVVGLRCWFSCLFLSVVKSHINRCLFEIHLVFLKPFYIRKVF